MVSQQPDPQRLITQLGLQLPILGFYDAPDPAPFAPTIMPKEGACIFSHYTRWVKGETLQLTSTQFGCRGAGRWLCGSQAFGGEKFVEFLVDTEGLKDSHELMTSFVENSHYYKMEHGHIFIGLLHADQWPYLKTITFLVNPDQLSALAIGAQYHAGAADPAPVLAPFGSGCSQLINFPDLNLPQSIIGGTDIAMRQHLPPDILLFTVTRPMFYRLCSLDERSFLYKGFWARLGAARQGSRAKKKEK
jgi:hypothetical protein